MIPGMHYENATARSLGMVRAAVFTLWIGIFFRVYPNSPAMPSGLYIERGAIRWMPDGVNALLAGLGSATWFPWVFVPVVLAAALGLRPFRLWGPLALGLILMLEFWAKGFSGFVYHAWVLPLVMAGVLVCAPSADGFALDRREKAVRDPAAYRFPLLVMTTAGLFCYMFIAVHRMVHGDYEIFQGEALHAWLLVRSQAPSSYGFEFGTTVANTPWLFAIYKAGFVISTVIESLAPLCLYARRFALGWLGFILIFHLLSLVTLNIFFWENSLLLPLLFLPLGLWAGRTNAAGDGRVISPA